MNYEDRKIKRRIIILSIITFIGVIILLSGMYLMLKVVTRMNDPMEHAFALLLCSMLVMDPLGIIMFLIGRKKLKEAICDYTACCEQIELRDPKKMRRIRLVARILWISAVVVMILLCIIFTITLSNKLNETEMFDLFALTLIVPLCIFFIGLMIEGLVIFAHENYMNAGNSKQDK